MKNALVIIDMLNDFSCRPVNVFRKGQTVIDPIARLKAAFRGCGAQVIYGNDAHSKDTKEFSDWTPHCLVGSSGAQIIQELSPQPGDIVLYRIP
jgi:nicotinamidase/pyrazinamidase